MIPFILELLLSETMESRMDFCMDSLYLSSFFCSSFFSDSAVVKAASI